MEKDREMLEKLLEEININGFEVKEFNELKNLKTKHKAIVPILVKYLNSFEADNYKDAIVGVLGVKGFIDATETLINAYNDKDWNGDKWAIGDSLYNIQDERFEDAYISVIKSKKNGISRQMIVALLGKLKCEKAIPDLIELLIDGEVCGHAIMALGYFKNFELIKYIEPFLYHEKKWIQKEAARAIKKIKG